MALKRRIRKTAAALLVAAVRLLRRFRVDVLDDARLEKSAASFWRSSPDEKAFERYLTRRTLRDARAVTIFLCLVVLLWRIPELLLPGHGQAASSGVSFSLVRRDVLLVSLLGCALFFYPRWTYRPLVLAGTFIGVCYTANLGYQLGRIGGFEYPWFSQAMMVVFGNALIHVRFVPRILVTLSLAGALFIGYLLPHPEYLSQPMLPATLGIFGLACICSVTMGALHFAYVRQTFVQAVNLAQGALALKRMNSRLEAHVRAQTSELRQLAAHIETVREEERRRIAQGLHDELGQELVAIRYAVALAKRRCEQVESPVQANLEQIDALVERTAGATYMIVNELRPRMIDDLGLVATVEWLLQKTSERYDIPCHLSKPENPPPLDPHLAITVFRVLQEALTNIIRHAKATQIHVELGIADERLRLCVRDDGVGFRPTDRRGHGGIGLVSMRERAFAAGGTFHIECAPTGGTVVTVELPLHPQATQLAQLEPCA